MQILKSVGAVFAGLILIVVTHSVADFILEKTGVFTPPDQRFDTTWMVVTALVYRIIFTIAGGYLTSALAPSRPMLHSLILGAFGFAISAIAAIPLIPMDLGPAWYPIALAITAFPAAWFGGKLKAN
ncbi:MAG: hypothetical protein WBD22_12175 [Pyrinomonadaceae bacterium]